MAKAAPNPHAPWNLPRALVVAAASVLGLFGLGIGARQLFTPVDTDGGAGQLEQWVDDYLARDGKESTAERHRDIARKVRQLEEVLAAPRFGQLPPGKQEALRNRFRELSAYREYEQALAKIEDPRTARTEDQLKSIRAALTSLRVPPEYLAEWSGTPAREKHNEWLADCDAVAQAVQNVLRAYLDLVRDGQRVLANRDAASLPTRAKEALDRERQLPALKAGPTDLIPGSRRVTYATVFAFAGVAEARAAWQKLRETLEKLAGLRKP